MNRLQELTERFRGEPTALLFGIELEAFEEGRTIMRFPIRKIFLTTHGVVQGGITFTVADLAGVYASMAMIRSDEEAVLNNKPQIAKYLRPAVPQEKFLTAEARCLDDRRWIDNKGRGCREIVMRVEMKSQKGELKAEFVLYFTILPRFILERLRRENSKE